MKTHFSIVLLCVIVTGCYTQIRSPEVEEARWYEPAVPEQNVSVQRFEYYHHYGQYGVYDPYDFGMVSFYEPYSRWSYVRTPVWRRHNLAWEYSYWATVYDPWWRGYHPRVVVPHVVYSSGVRPRAVAYTEAVNPRPRIRRTGFEGVVPSATAVRTDESSSSSSNTSATSNSPPPTKQTTTEQKDEEEKEEKREEKRGSRKRRGGMR